MTGTEQLAGSLVITERGRNETSATGVSESVPDRAVSTFMIVVLVLAVSGGVLVLQETQEWTAALAIVGSGMAAVLAAGATYWLSRRYWTELLRKRSADSDEFQASMRSKLWEQLRREVRLRTECGALQKQIDQLSQSNSDLADELNRRKEAERTLALQQQDFARSRGVLQLHVQASVEELQKLQRRHELILNSADDGICGVDMEGNIAFANPKAAHILGDTVEKLIGRPLAQLFCGIPSAKTYDEDAPTNGNNSEIQLNRPDGTHFVVEYTRSPIREGTSTMGEVMLFKDITERKRNEEELALKATELARSNAELEQFAFVASHDLQEPLRKILAFGDLLKAKCAPVELGGGQEYLERMQNAAARMRTLIDDLLTFSRVISRTEPFGPVDLNTVVREVLSDLEVRIEKSEATVHIGKLPTIEADATQMRQLLQNLIGNALKFHDPSAKPVVHVFGTLVSRERDVSETSLLPRRAGAGERKVDEQVCELTVLDNGIGFDEKYLKRIFSVFQRLHGRQEYEGTGIGLAVCRRIVDRHNGTLTAKSKPGQGATFIVVLPVHQSQKSAPAA